MATKRSNFIEGILPLAFAILMYTCRTYYPDWWQRVKETVGWEQKSSDNQNAPATKSTDVAMIPVAPAPRPKTAEEIITETVDSILRFQGQDIITQAHPTVTLKTYRVHEIVPVWRNEVNTGNLRDVEGCVIRATLYWHGVVQKEGFTKLNLLVDFEALRIVGGEIISTNGMTSDELGQLTLDLAKGALQGYLLYQQIE